MNGSVDSVAVQTWPVMGAGAVAVAPLPAQEATAKASPHPSPLPQAGGGAGLPASTPSAAPGHAPIATQAEGPTESLPPPLAEAPAESLPLPLAGEGWGEGKAGAGESTATKAAGHASEPHTTATTTVAQPAAFAQPQSGAGMVGTTVITLLLVIGFILLLAWFAKRMPGLAGASNPALKIVGSLPLGPRERVVVVAVGDTQLLLSTGPNGTRALHTLEQPLPLPSATPSPFAQVLAQQFGKKKS